MRDAVVLDFAFRERRILLTFDRDFGDLAFAEKRPSPPAIILIRFIPVTPEETARAIAEVLASQSGIEGFFVVLGRDYIRKRPLPR